MATTPPDVVARPDLIAALVPGDGRYRFLTTFLPRAVGAWIAVPGPRGDEPGRVVATPGKVEAGTSETFPRAGRLLEPAEVREVLHQAAATRELIPAAARLVRTLVPGAELTGLRRTLGGPLVCTCLLPSGSDQAVLAEALTPHLGPGVAVETGGSGAYCGGLGRLDSMADEPEERALALERLSTYPRLGAVVRSGGVEGVLMGISTRHAEARIREPGGREVVVAVTELEALSDLPGA